MKTIHKMLTALVASLGLMTVSAYVSAEENTVTNSEMQRILHLLPVLQKSDQELPSNRILFPTRQAFGEVIYQGKHYPFINIDVAQKQKIMEHHFYQAGNETRVLIKFLPQQESSGFQQFIHRYDEKSFINLIDNDGKSMGCVMIENY